VGCPDQRSIVGVWCFELAVKHKSSNIHQKGRFPSGRHWGQHYVRDLRVQDVVAVFVRVPADPHCLHFSNCLSADSLSVVTHSVRSVWLAGLARCTLNTWKLIPISTHKLQFYGTNQVWLVISFKSTLDVRVSHHHHSTPAQLVERTSPARLWRILHSRILCTHSARSLARKIHARRLQPTIAGKHGHFHWLTVVCGTGFSVARSSLLLGSGLIHA